MTTQKQIKEWIPSAVSIFQKYIPVIRMPEIHVVSDRTVFKTRKEITKKLRAYQTEIDEKHYDSIMEMIHGELGDAILIQQKYVPDPDVNKYAEIYFRRFFWHEMGHFYAINNECRNEDVYCYNNPDLKNEPAKQKGYWMWSEFIAEAIALYVDECHCRIDNKAFYHPELLTWEPEQWGGIVERLMNLLDMAIHSCFEVIDEAALAMYFASLLMEDGIKRFVKAAEGGKLKVYDSTIMGCRLMEPGSIEPTCISDQPEVYQSALWNIKGILETQLQKEAFWEIDSDFLERLGQCVIELSNNKLEIQSEFDNYMS